jgi:hypothetical protein
MMVPYLSAISDDTPTYRGRAEAGSTITLLVDDSPVSTVRTDAEGDWSFTPTTALVDGLHTVRATARDSAGHTSASSNTRTFRVDTTPPAAPIVEAPAEGSFIGNNPPTYSGRAEAGSTVTFLVDDRVADTTTADADGNWSLTPTWAVAEGLHTARATAQDSVGNVSPAFVLRGFTVDTLPPRAPELNVPPAFNTRRPVIAGIAEPHSTITMWLDKTAAGTTAAAETGLWVFTPDTEWPEGGHQVKATARDAAGNVSSGSAEFSFTIAVNQKSHYGWNCATAPGSSATWALLTLALALRGRWKPRDPAGCSPHDS